MLVLFSISEKTPKHDLVIILHPTSLASGSSHFFPPFCLQVGLLDLELNRLTKALFLAQLVLSIVMEALLGFVGLWLRNLFRFVVLFSYIIPIRYLREPFIYLFIYFGHGFHLLLH